MIPDLFTWGSIAVSAYAVAAGLIGLRAIRTRGDEYRKRVSIHHEQVARIGEKLKGTN